MYSVVKVICRPRHLASSAIAKRLSMPRPLTTEYKLCFKENNEKSSQVCVGRLVCVCVCVCVCVHTVRSVCVQCHPTWVLLFLHLSNASDGRAPSSLIRRDRSSIVALS